MLVYEKRRQKLRSLLVHNGVEAMFVSYLPHIRYLSGFTGSHAYLLITDKDSFFFTDSRYMEQSKKEVNCENIHILKKHIFLTISEQGILHDNAIIGFEKHHMTVQQWEQVKEVFPHLSWKGLVDIIEKLSAQKDPEEIAFLRKATQITDIVFTKILDELKPGISEREIAAKISYFMKIHGADGDSYDPIVASGERSALPHAQPTDALLQKGDFVLMDFGALYRGYHADMTRTVVLGTPSQRQTDIYNLVLKSQMEGINMLRSGVVCEDVDRACRQIFLEKGYKKEFCHATGHGIGLEVHTHPAVSYGIKTVLLENFVITIEPGLYFPGEFGIRIEDDCVIEREGCDILNTSPKTLLVC